MSPISVVAYLSLFVVVGFLFLLVALLLGRLLRADVPTREKLQPYECGEPPVGSSFVQFDLRFYVVALVFMVFEVEVALFFPPATIFGQATQLMGPQASAAVAEERCDRLGMAVKDSREESSGAQETFRYPPGRQRAADARLLALAALADLGVFFAVILLGFAYVWYRGDLDWVRAVSPPRLSLGEGMRD
ncbi:MAG: NADH-quinone oxidoreductase subunit A [Thermoguttaceae bacterium]|jgi:NADH-quinone oxidoreductase subunit A